MKKTNKGFTIVELVIVIAVIAILAAVLIPTFSGIIGKANDSVSFQESKNTLTEYISQNGEADAGMMFYYETSEEGAAVASYDVYLYANGKLTLVGKLKGDTFTAAEGITGVTFSDASTTITNVTVPKHFKYALTIGSYNFNGVASFGTVGTEMTDGYGEALVATYSTCTQISNKTYNLQQETTNCTSSVSANSIGNVTDFTCTYTTSGTLPATITVKVGNTTLAATTQYTWDQTAGVLTIPYAYITGNVVITVTATAEQP